MNDNIMSLDQIMNEMYSDDNVATESLASIGEAFGSFISTIKNKIAEAWTKLKEKVKEYYNRAKNWLANTKAGKAVADAKATMAAKKVFTKFRKSAMAFQGQLRKVKGLAAEAKGINKLNKTDATGKLDAFKDRVKDTSAKIASVKYNIPTKTEFSEVKGGTRAQDWFVKGVRSCFEGTATLYKNVMDVLDLTLTVGDKTTTISKKGDAAADTHEVLAPLRTLMTDMTKIFMYLTACMAQMANIKPVDTDSMNVTGV